MNCPICGKDNADWRWKCEYCGADMKVAKQEVIPLEQQLLKLQGELTTRGSSLVGGFCGLGCSVLTLVAFLAFAAFATRMGVDLGVFGIMIGPIGIFGGVAFFLYSIWFIIQGTVVSNRKLTCPECGEKISVLSTESTFLCPGCSELVLLGKDKSSGLKKVACPMCASHWVASDDLGARACHGCGAMLEVSEGRALLLPQDDACQVCKQPLHKSAYACLECGALRSRPHLNNMAYYQTTHRLTSELYKEDNLDNLPTGFQPHSIWRTSPTGELIRAAWLGQLITASVENSSDYALIAQVKILERLVKGISSLNLALEEPHLAPGVQEIFNGYTQVVQALLQRPIDPANGQYRLRVSFPPGNYTTDGPNSTQGQIQQFLFTVSAEQNLLAKRLAAITGQPVTGLWPIPLFTFTSSSINTNTVFAVSPWEKVKIENWLFSAKAPETLPVFRANPCPERVAVA